MSRFGIAILLAFMPSAIFAEGATNTACSYRPSQLVGAGSAAAIGTASAGVSAAGVGANAAGFYTLTHAVTGATMLGSTAGGASAAGTVGIMGGTAGAVGTTAAVITAPVTIVATAIVAAGIASYEGVCYFTDERITDHDEVLARLQDVALNADVKKFMVWDDKPNKMWMMRIRGPRGFEVYRVENLYIVNDVLMHRDWLKNTVIGNIAFVAEP